MIHLKSFYCPNLKQKRVFPPLPNAVALQGLGFYVTIATGKEIGIQALW